jgi:hypothetical protein
MTYRSSLISLPVFLLVYVFSQPVRASEGPHAAETASPVELSDKGKDRSDLEDRPSAKSGEGLRESDAGDSDAGMREFIADQPSVPSPREAAPSPTIVKLITATIDDGVRAERFIVNSPDGNAAVARAILFDPKKYQFHISAQVDPVSSGLSLAEHAARSNALVAISGGFLRLFSPATPQGLLRVNGNTLSVAFAEPGYDGYLCTGPKGGVASIYIGVFKDLPDEKSLTCLQSGPVLMYLGEVRDMSSDGLSPFRPYFFDHRWARAFVGRTLDGDVVFGRTDPLTVAELQAFLKNLRVSEALNLSGDATAGLIVREENPDVFGEDRIPIPTAIVAVKK